ncbi:uncharacterized protein [Centruroides vittatus]|uniref:uncharacterized protein n=1 Tax=Centruroides vittatus TaxID=120091 RepID=UPI00350FF079
MTGTLTCIQEPYTIQGEIVRFGQWKIFANNTTADRTKCGIILRNSNINATLVPDLSSNKITVITMHQEPVDFLISVYFPPTDNDEECIIELSEVINKLTGKSYIIMGDVNAKSSLWFHEEEDNRGKLIEDLVNEMDGISLNTSDLPTFQTDRAKGWTNVCLAPTSVGSNITTCSTLHLNSASDHRYILTEIAMPIHSGPTTQQHYRWRTNWDSFRVTFGNLWRNFHFQDLTTKEEVNKYAEHLTLSLQKALQSSTTYLPGTNKTHWWNDALDTEKRKIRKLRRQWLRETDPTRKNSKAKDYAEAQ